jgi:molybdopterin synthase sulfur carrier subunit
LTAARHRFGPSFEDVLAGSRVWLNGEPTSDDAPVGGQDEVAVIPPVSGGAA